MLHICKIYQFLSPISPISTRHCLLSLPYGSFITKLDLEWYLAIESHSVYKMSINLFILCFFLMSSLEYIRTSPTEQKIQLLERNSISLAQNVSELRKDVVVVNVIREYLAQEISFKNELKRQLEDIAKNCTEQNLRLEELAKNNTKQSRRIEELAYNNTVLQERTTEQHLRLDELESNYTALQKLYTKGTIEQQHLQVQLQELENKHSALQLQYSKNLQEQEQKNNNLQDLVKGVQQNFSVIEVGHADSLHDVVKEFRENISVIDILYKDNLQQTTELKQKQSTQEQAIRQLSLSLTYIEAKRKSDNETLWNSTENIKQTLVSVRQALLLNMSSLSSDLNHYRASRKSLIYLAKHFTTSTTWYR